MPERAEANEPKIKPDATPERPARQAAGGARRSGPAGGRRPARRTTPQESTPPPIIPEREPAPDRLIVGQVRGAHGLRGEFRIALATNHPEGLRGVPTLYIGDEQEPWAVRRVHPLPGGKEAIVRLSGLTSPEDAAALRGRKVRADREALPPLPEGELYHYQLIGLDVFDEAGTLLGRLAEIIETGANDVYVVRGPAGEILLPAINEVVRAIDLERGQMTVRQQAFY